MTKRDWIHIAAIFIGALLLLLSVVAYYKADHSLSVGLSSLATIIALSSVLSGFVHNKRREKEGL